MTDIVQHPLLDEILDEHRSHNRGEEKAWAGYRSHAHRVFNLARTLAPPAPDLDERLAIVAAFHDIEVFTSLDYLAPSIDTQTAWLERTGRADWIDELAHVSAFHHKPTAYHGAHEAVTEAFRRADWCEVSLGRMRKGIDPELVKELDGRWSVAGFLPQGVAKFTLRWLPRHPLDPAPILRGRRALERMHKPA